MGMAVISVIAFLVLIMFGFGYVQDAFGARCTDLWGWEAQPCAQAGAFWLLYLGFLPGVFIPFSVFASAFLVYGLFEEAQLVKAALKKRKRS